MVEFMGSLLSVFLGIVFIGLVIGFAVLLGLCLAFGIFWIFVKLFGPFIDEIFDIL